MTDTPKLQQAADSGLPSHDLLCVLQEIKDAKATLAALYNRKREIEDSEKEKRWKAEKVAKTDKHRLWVKMLQMASKGMSVSKIAEELGVSKHNMDSKISRAWRKEFPAHYAANREKIYQLGLLSALRDSPPIFISQNGRLVRPLSDGVADCPQCHSTQSVARHNADWTCKCGYCEIVDDDREAERYGHLYGPNVQGHPCRAADGIQIDGLSASPKDSTGGCCPPPPKLLRAEAAHGSLEKFFHYYILYTAEELQSENSRLKRYIIKQQDARKDDDGKWIDGNGDYIDVLNWPNSMIMDKAVQYPTE